MKRFAFLLLLCLTAFLHGAEAELPVFFAQVVVETPGAAMGIPVKSPQTGNATLLLLEDETGAAFVIYSGIALTYGSSVLPWDGRDADGLPVPPGVYTLQLYFERFIAPTAPPAAEEGGAAAGDGAASQEARPLLENVTQSARVVSSRGIEIAMDVGEAGTLAVSLAKEADGTREELLSMEVAAGPVSFLWPAKVNGVRVPAGAYALELTLRTGDGEESAPQRLPFEVVDVSPSYTDAPIGSFWSMAPGEPDDAYIWDVLIQPITVYDDSSILSNGHAYLMENPDGTGKKLAQIHGLSQGLRVVGVPNEHGYVLVEAFSNYSLTYFPRTEEARAEAYDIKRGYVQAKHLKTVEVDQHIGLLVDKLTQRMYLFIDGKRVTELLISTGKNGDGTLHRETIPGEFTTIGFVGGFESNGYLSDLAIRYNGGSLLHEVPSILLDDGETRSFALAERQLGGKASAGCIRVQRALNPDGYNQRRLWDMLLVREGEQPRYKVLIWDDRGRTDTPEVWYPLGER